MANQLTKIKLVEASRRYRAQHPERSRESAKKYYMANREACIKASKMRTLKTPNTSRFREVRKRALERGILFDLSLQDIVWPEYCPVLGIKLDYRRGTGGSKDNSPSIDRIILDKGYTKGNIAVISMIANRIKTNATLDQIKAVQGIRDQLNGGSLSDETEAWLLQAILQMGMLELGV